MDDIRDGDGLRAGEGTEAEERYVSILMNRLIELREQSDPSGGDASAIGKDLRALQALGYAGRLVKALAGWAIDHQVGLANENLSFVSLGPSQTRELPEYQEARRLFDNHSHELTGRQIAENLDPIDAGTARQIAINLLHSNAGAMPLQVAHRLSDALRALDMNDVQPILRTKSLGRKVTFEEQQLQMQAICFWKFRHATGLFNAASAQNAVAEAYGVSPEAIRTWEKRLRIGLGQLKVSREIGFSKNAASYVAAEKVRSRAISLLENHEHYGDAKLKETAERYKACRRD